MPKQAKEENPIAEFVPVQYVCSMWPKLGLGGGIEFDKGFYTAETEKDRDRVQRSDAFKNKQIIVLQKNKNKPPTVAESAELAALRELRDLAPQAHRGAVGTKNLVS